MAPLWKPFLSSPFPTAPTHLPGALTHHTSSCYLHRHVVLPGMPSHLLSFSQLYLTRLRPLPETLPDPLGLPHAPGASHACLYLSLYHPKRPQAPNAEGSEQACEGVLIRPQAPPQSQRHLLPSARTHSAKTASRILLCTRPWAPAGSAPIAAATHLKVGEVGVQFQAPLHLLFIILIIWPYLPNPQRGQFQGVCLPAKSKKLCGNGFVAQRQWPNGQAIR